MCCIYICVPVYALIYMSHLRVGVAQDRLYNGLVRALGRDIVEERRRDGARDERLAGVGVAVARGDRDVLADEAGAAAALVKGELVLEPVCFFCVWGSREV